MSTFRRMMLASLAMGVPLAVMADQPASQSSKYQPPRKDPTTLVEKVRRGVPASFFNPNVPLSQGWVNVTSCVSGPNEGAMGHHLVFVPDPTKPPPKVVDGVLDPEQPEALIYEPQGNGYFRLVGVEFIQIADDWAARVAKDPTLPATPRVNGQLMNLVSTPNRYGLPAFYELHVWAFADNPRGNFADWNTQVNCNKAKPEDLTSN